MVVHHDPIGNRHTELNGHGIAINVSSFNQPMLQQLFGRQQTILDVFTLRFHVRTRQLNSDRPEGARRALDSLYSRVRLGSD